MDKYRYTNESLSDGIAVADLPDAFGINNRIIRRAGIIGLTIGSEVAFNAVRVFAQEPTGNNDLQAVGEICGQFLCLVVLPLVGMITLVALGEREKEDTNNNDET